jgi:threonine/homoserine/homoserine lactone efflux protein
VWSYVGAAYLIYLGVMTLKKRTPRLIRKSNGKATDAFSSMASS